MCVHVLSQWSVGFFFPLLKSLLPWRVGAGPAGDPGHGMAVLVVVLFGGGGCSVVGEQLVVCFYVLRLVFLPGGQSSAGRHGVCSSRTSEKSLPAVH